MESTQDYIKCPKCGNEEAHQEFIHSTGEESIMCLVCGYSRRFFITNWNDREREGGEWIPMFSIEEVGGSGSYKVRAKGRNGYEVGSFLNSTAPEEFCEMVNARKDEIGHAEYTIIQHGTPHTTILIMGDIEKLSASDHLDEQKDT